METLAENLIDGLERDVAAAIMRRTVEMTFSSPSDDELVYIADDTFLELDRSEARDVRGCL